VPASALSGLISVTNPSGTVNSPSSFTVVGTAPVSHLGNWSTPVQINASGISGPPLDQHTGNWSDPVRINIIGARSGGTRTATARTIGAGRRIGEGSGGG
jgi:hypothetical protein